MAGKFHVNPETGNVSPCTATQSCPFGGQSGNDNHFLSPGEARAAYESMMKSHELVNKKVTPASLQSFNDEGLTDNMVNFRNDLMEINTAIQAYDRYRSHGLNSARSMPDLPAHLEPYLDKKKIYDAWQQVNYNYIRNEYINAMKTYYMDNVFNNLDIDCMFDDDEIAEMAGVEENIHTIDYDY